MEFRNDSQPKKQLKSQLSFDLLRESKNAEKSEKTNQEASSSEKSEKTNQEASSSGRSESTHSSSRVGDYFGISGPIPGTIKQINQKWVVGGNGEWHDTNNKPSAETGWKRLKDSVYKALNL